MSRVPLQTAANHPGDRAVRGRTHRVHRLSQTAFFRKEGSRAMPQLPRASQRDRRGHHPCAQRLHELSRAAQRLGIRACSLPDLSQERPFGSSATRRQLRGLPRSAPEGAERVRIGGRSRVHVVSQVRALRSWGARANRVHELPQAARLQAEAEQHRDVRGLPRGARATSFTQPGTPSLHQLPPRFAASPRAQQSRLRSLPSA